MTDMNCKKVLFVCGHNAGRSQMAEAFIRRLADGKIEAGSAGTSPSKTLNPTVVAVMEEIGVSMELHRPKLLTPDMYQGDVCVFRMG